MVGVSDGAVQIELNHGLGLADCVNLTLQVRMLKLSLGDVGGEFDDLVGLAIRSHDRVVRRLNPDLLLILPDPLELRYLRFAVVQLGPEFLILIAAPLGRINEHAVVLSLHLREGVAES